jgi:hypothetical protein
LEFTEPVFGEFDKVSLLLPSEEENELGLVSESGRLWTGKFALPTDRVFEGNGILTLEGHITDEAGNALPLPIRFELSVTNALPRIDQVTLESARVLKKGDRLKITVRGAPGKSGQVELPGYKTLPLREVTPEHYETQTRIDTWGSFSIPEIKAVLENLVGDKAMVKKTLNLLINPVIPEIIDNFERKTLGYSFQSQATLTLLNGVLKTEYWLNPLQPWAAWSTGLLISKNLSGYKPVLQVRIKGSGNAKVKGMIKLRTQTQPMDYAWVKEKNGYEFDLKSTEWKTFQFPLTAKDAEKLSHLGTVDVILSGPPTAKREVMAVDDLILTYSAP